MNIGNYIICRQAGGHLSPGMCRVCGAGRQAYVCRHARAGRHAGSCRQACAWRQVTISAVREITCRAADVATRRTTGMVVRPAANTEHIGRATGGLSLPPTWPPVDMTHPACLHLPACVSLPACPRLHICTCLPARLYRRRDTCRATGDHYNGATRHTQGRQATTITGPGRPVPGRPGQARPARPGPARRGPTWLGPGRRGRGGRRAGG